MLKNRTDRYRSSVDYSNSNGMTVSDKAFDLFLVGFRSLFGQITNLSDEHAPADEDIIEKDVKSDVWWRHLLAGGVAGAVSRTATAPLDRIKVYMQVHPQRISIRETLVFMINEGGYRSMWRGNMMNVIKIAPESAIKFATYENVKNLIRKGEDRPLRLTERFAAGATAGSMSQCIIYPMEVLKTRLALQKTGQYKGILDATFKIFRFEGVRSFYRGFVPGVAGTVPYAGIDLAVYETLKNKYLSIYGGMDQPTLVVSLGCGSMSSALGQLCAYPLALVRTRLQIEASKDSLAEKSCKEISEGFAEVGMIGMFRRIVKNEGVTGLYKGIAPNFIKVIPAVSIGYAIYEYISRCLGIKMS